ncbi:hypothetical protein HOP50_02g16810 [Chloropicon primus]|uniref:Uncharacterized protein n=1 Tax=Chloropicon primus TaxID=1764295 RepID=A0A5B8MFL2_9CHLO|nr:hypothetical protein A3770_02p16850 [Chloropicon primus]UPQ98375.1 hypothetical protein HOP50_02g16810 [Chloropicon primus]|eukprot:QDZ19167.1 hypothetical protein A3770_02p16850 [Chloropicon primus]
MNAVAVAGGALRCGAARPRRVTTRWGSLVQCGITSATSRQGAARHASSSSPSPAAWSRGGRGGSLVAASSERDPLFGNEGAQYPDPSRDFAIFWPTCFREAATSVNSLQQGHVVVVNVGGIPNLEDQQRAVDFIAGACYALEGQQDVLAESIFIFFPRLVGDFEDKGSALKHSQAARDALVSLARSEIKGSLA